jgi:hypothetical protein
LLPDRLGPVRASYDHALVASAQRRLESELATADWLLVVASKRRDKRCGGLPVGGRPSVDPLGEKSM